MDEQASVPVRKSREELFREQEQDFNFQKMSFPRRLLGHLSTITHHKFYVAQGCFGSGLYLQGILHDLSKYSPAEFCIGVRYFDGGRSPNVVERIVKGGLSEAWLHHKGRNKHHFEYWIDYSRMEGMTVYANRMPMRYLVEMVCDRRAACMAYHGEAYSQGDAWDYYDRGKTRIIMDDDTRIVLENCLMLMKTDGDEACFSFMRKLLEVTRGTDYSAASLGLHSISGFTASSLDRIGP